MELILEKNQHRKLSKEKSANLGDRTTRLVDKAAEQTHNMASLSSAQREARSKRESSFEAEGNINEISSKTENTPSSRVSYRPLLSKLLNYILAC